MADNSDYTPGFYGKKRMKPSEWLNSQIHKWTSQRAGDKKKTQEPAMTPCICISRKIGVGALEIADILGQKLGYKVVDREILEYMAQEGKITENTVSVFDERYPGKMSEFLALIMNEKSFIKSDYSRLLAKAVIAMANLEPTIFVGRGTHLILPREEVLAVRFICSNEYRINRLSTIMKISKTDSENRMNLIDKEQRLFFETMYQKKDASPYEFDLVINMDHIRNAEEAAKIVLCAFEGKFKVGRN